MSEWLASYAKLLEACLLDVSSPSKRIEVIKSLLAGERVKDAFGGFFESPNVFLPRGEMLMSFEKFFDDEVPFLGDSHQKVLRNLLASAIAAEKARPPKLPKLTLHFLHPFDGGRLTVKLDPDLTPAEIVNELVALDFLWNGNRNYFRLAIRGGQILDSRRSIREFSVKDGSEIRITAFEENA